MSWNNIPAYLKTAPTSIGPDPFTSGIGSGRGAHITTKNGVFYFVSADGVKTMSPTFDPKRGNYIDIVVVGAGMAVAKTFYEEGYDETEANPPDCWSNDGKYPDLAASKPQAPSCDACPNNVFGSRITASGKDGKLCSDRKLLAAINVYDANGPLYQFSVSPSNLKPWAAHAREARGRGVPVNRLVTRVFFDPTRQGGQTYEPAPMLDQNGQPAGFFFVPESFIPHLDMLAETEECKNAIGANANPRLPGNGLPAPAANGALGYHPQAALPAPAVAPAPAPTFQQPVTPPTAQAPVATQPAAFGQQAQAQPETEGTRRKRRTKEEMARDAAAAQAAAQAQQQPAATPMPVARPAGPDPFAAPAFMLPGQTPAHVAAPTLTPAAPAVAPPAAFGGHPVFGQSPAPAARPAAFGAQPAAFGQPAPAPAAFSSHPFGVATGVPQTNSEIDAMLEGLR